MGGRGLPSQSDANESLTMPRPELTSDFSDLLKFDSARYARIDLIFVWSSISQFLFSVGLVSKNGIPIDIDSVTLVFTASIRFKDVAEFDVEPHTNNSPQGSHPYPKVYPAPC